MTTEKTGIQLLQDPKIKAQIALALPKHMNADRMSRIALTEARRIPKLNKCDPMSFIGAIIQCSQLGLEPGNSLGHAYLIPFDKKFKDAAGAWHTKTECQLIIGYRGMIDLARRSGQIISLNAQAVYENDQFSYQYGSTQFLHHIPARGDRGQIICFYAIAHLVGGGEQFEVMSKEAVDDIRKRSKSADNGPWVTDYEEMGRKTLCRRLFKYLPVSIELQRAVTLDEEAERGEQNNAAIIEGEFDLSQEPAENISKADEIANQLN